MSRKMNIQNRHKKFKRRPRPNQKRRRQASRRHQLRTTRKKPKQTTKLMVRKSSKLRILETKMWIINRLLIMLTKKRTQTPWLTDLARIMSEERVNELGKDIAIK